MEFRRATLDTCESASGVVVVIDVVRAFSTAAFALANGAASITLVSTVAEALALRRERPGSLIIGEVGGRPVADFDFANSPSQVRQHDFTGRHLIQRTSNGTQGMIHSRQAQLLLGGSLCCASATARFIQRCAPATVTFVITGVGPEADGDEDAACADYLEAMLCNRPINLAEITRRVYASPAGRHFTDPQQPEFPLADLECCVQVDRFDFAMPAYRRNGQLELVAERPSPLS